MRENFSDYARITCWIPEQVRDDKLENRWQRLNIFSPYPIHLLLLSQLLPERFILIQILEQPALAADIFGTIVLAAF